LLHGDRHAARDSGPGGGGGDRCAAVERELVCLDHHAAAATLLSEVAAIEPPFESWSVLACTAPPARSPSPVAVLPEKMPLGRVPVAPEMMRLLAVTRDTAARTKAGGIRRNPPAGEKAARAGNHHNIAARADLSCLPQWSQNRAAWSVGISTRTFPPAPASVIETLSAAMP